MALDHRCATLVASIKDAENEAKTGETLFLVELVTAATLDKDSNYTLEEVYEALIDAKSWILLDALNLFPLLVASDKDAASDMIQIIAREGNAKETVIAVQEALERLEGVVRGGDESPQKCATQLTRLLAACREFIPRLQLRRTGPLETLQPILMHLGAIIEAVAPLIDYDDGRNIISSVSKFIEPVLPWLSQSAHAGGPDGHTVTERLALLLCGTVAACAPHIRGYVAPRRFEEYHPRLVFRSFINPDSKRGVEVMQEALVVARTLGMAPQTLASHPLSLGKLILLAHEPPSSIPTTSEYIQTLIPILTPSLQQNVALDESLAILLVFMSASSLRLPQEVVDPLATLLTPLASTHLDPPTRHIAFRILAALLSRASPSIHLAHLSSLLTDCPFPQMRVAAVGLVKEAFLKAITSPETEPSLFKSKTLVRAFGPIIFRPDPPDLFVSPDNRTLQKFLDSSEPARLTECLAFYYVLLKRDAANSSGIRDRDVLGTVENSLLAPLRAALAVWLKGLSSMTDSHTLMPIASLETSLERVDAAIASLPLS